MSSRASPVAAHAPLEAGDIFVVGVTGGATPTVALLGLVELHEGDSVVLTDRGWLAGGGFRAGEGQTVHVSQPLIVRAGVVIQIALQPGSSGMVIDPAGDQLILLRGSIAPNGTPTGPLLDVFHTGAGFSSTPRRTPPPRCPTAWRATPSHYRRGERGRTWVPPRGHAQSCAPP
ncbi:MAG: hypothetical protein IPH72_02695 [Sandaracinaceae bacterium]|nr:hypothetical protein [Sandaracinaceae bacterium]